MIEAIDETYQGIEWNSWEESSSSSFSSCSSSWEIHHHLSIFKNSLHQTIYQSINQSIIVEKVYAKLQELELTEFEKILGAGAFGVVLKLHGKEKKNIALKLERELFPIANKNKELVGDALGLMLPKGAHLGRATGILTYYQGEIHYLENYDAEQHAEHYLVGVFSKAIDGVPLRNRVSYNAPLELEAAKGYGKHLAEALLALHGEGYAHRDIHLYNVLAKNPQQGKSPHRIKLLDFGLATKISPKGIQEDWKDFGSILKRIVPKQIRTQNLHFKDLLYNPNKGLLAHGQSPYTEQEILNHPFFV